jgi:hypothetical protein
MRKSIRYTGIAVISAAMLAAGTASAHDRYHRGGGGGSAGAAIAMAAVAGLALGALVASSQPVVAAPAPVYAPPQPVSYAAPQCRRATAIATTRAPTCRAAAARQCSTPSRSRTTAIERDVRRSEMDGA